MRTEKEYKRTIDLKNVGLNNCEISRVLKIPRTTINDWIINKPNFNKCLQPDFSPQDYIKQKKLTNTYSYILGLYLGDGYINKSERTYKLRIFNDIQYFELNDFIALELQKLFPDNKVGFVKRGRCLEIYVYSNKLPKIFPQNGKGRKHTRKIKLSNWQKDIISPKHLLMGLYHSDGCYYVNNVGKYSYESYCFSNTSLDIHKIFQNCCDVLEINYTKTKKMMETQIRKRESVEKLKKMIGTKKEILLYCDI